MTYETILVTRAERVGTITLNRPKALNALNSQVMGEVTAAAANSTPTPALGRSSSPAREGVRRRRDIKEMASLSFSEVFEADFSAPGTSWPRCLTR